MSAVTIVGGGIAGLAAAAALGESGYQVDLLEARPYLGGRASSYPLPAGEPGEVIDNCQHILLRCCSNLLNLYERLGVRHLVRFHREFYFIEPGGRISTLRAGPLPAPAHLAGSLLRMRCLGMADKIGIARALSAMRRERLIREDLDSVTMLDWLNEKRQTPRAVERFWRQVLVSAVNEDLERMAARHGFQVFSLGFLTGRESYEMGVPAAPLGDLYNSDAWKRLSNVQLRLRQAVERVEVDGGRVRAVIVRGERRPCDRCVVAVPFERVAELCPELGLRFDDWDHSPITGIHLWFDRIVTGLPHATLLDRTIQWFFNKSEGRYLQLVISASRALLTMPAAEVVALAMRELGEFLPRVKDATLLRHVVVKEARATFSARPGLEALRPLATTSIEGLYLAGDWIRTGWPATMEGAARSGYMTAEAVTRDAGAPKRFLLPDLA